MVSAAKPMFTRSRKLATYMRAINGISRLAARARMASAAAPFASPIPLISLNFLGSRVHGADFPLPGQGLWLISRAFKRLRSPDTSKQRQREVTRVGEPKR